MITDNEFEIDPFQLFSGAPIIVPGLELKIYQPKLYQIAEMGEEKFYHYLSFFKINKENTIKKIVDKEILDYLNDKTDYEILKMFIDIQPEIEKGIIEIMNLVLKDIEFIKVNSLFIVVKSLAGQQYIINDQYFTIIKEILYKIFNLEDSKPEFNPANSLASEIAKKIQKRREKLAEMQGKKTQSIFADFISILAVGLSSADISKMLNLTVYQIFNLMKRFGMYNQYNVQIQAMLQGASDIELIDWLQKI